jgi:malonyl-CoA/methylmalonyl-CoA synthetase
LDRFRFAPNVNYNPGTQSAFHLLFPEMSLLSLFDVSLVGRAAQPALECDQPGGTRANLTFGELEQRSNRLAHELVARGLKRGDRVAFFLANRVEIIDLWIAAVKLGLLLVPINVLYRERELRHILADAAPTAVITSRDLAGFIPANITIWDVDALASAATARDATRPAPAICDAETPLALIYTSGTTGASKGAVLTQGNFATNGLTLTSYWAITASDRYLATLPLFHVHGLANGVHCWLISGCHMRLLERFEHAKAAAWFEEYRPTLFFGVPTIFVRLLELPAEQARVIGSRLRLAVSGSAPLPSDVLEKFRELYGQTILERYGMTETLMNVSNPYAGERRAGTVGFPLPHVAVKICDEAGKEIADGTAGELWVRGPNVCSGYWRRPDATAAAWNEGWFRTGDIGVRAPDGYITLQGRRSDLIISAGFNIYPREIEELLLEQPGVREAAVLGAADPVRGEVPVAYVVAGGDFEEAALRARLATQLASFKLPRAYVRVDALPRTALGKVQKHLLPKWTGP